ncbi:MAG: hypothetical protein IJ654_02490 [Bacteroidales bacterium]|nr:hypothetical protein [Bacteroidales bacterium]
MKNRFIHFLPLLCLTALTACFDPSEPEYLYTNLYAFGIVEGGQIRIEPDGITFAVVEDKSDQHWMAHHRIFLCCDVLRMTDETSYEVRLNSYETVNSKPVLVKSETDESVYGTDAVSFDQDWGLDSRQRTLNMALRFTALKNSETTHTIDLVYDDQRSHRDTMFFALHHQGHGESYENTDHEATDFEIRPAYMTFSLSNAPVPEGAGSSIVICIEWDWFVPNGLQFLSRETRREKVCGTLYLP